MNLNQNNPLHLFQVPLSLMTTQAASQSLVGGPVINGTTAQQPQNSSSTAAQVPPNSTGLNNAQQMAQISALLSLDQGSLLAMLGINPPATTAAGHQIQNEQHMGPSSAIGISNQAMNQIRMPQTTQSQHPLLSQIHPTTSLLGPSALSTVYGQAHLFNQRPPVVSTTQHNQSIAQISPNSHQIKNPSQAQSISFPPQAQQYLAAQQAQVLARSLGIQPVQPNPVNVPVSSQATSQNELLMFIALQETIEKQKKQQLQQQQIEALQRLAAHEVTLQAQAQALIQQQQAVSKPSVMVAPAINQIQAPIIDLRNTAASQSTLEQQFSRKRVYNSVLALQEKIPEMSGLSASPPKISNLNQLAQIGLPASTSSSTTSPKLREKSDTIDDDEVIIVDDETMPKLTPETTKVDDKSIPDSTPKTNPLNEQIETHLLRLAELNKDKSDVGHTDMDLFGMIATIPHHIVHKMLDDILNTTPV